MLKVVTALAIVFMSLALVGLATGLGARYPRFAADNPSQVAGSYGGIAYMVIAVLFILITIALLGWPSSVYLFHQSRGIPLDGSAAAGHRRVLPGRRGAERRDVVVLDAQRRERTAGNGSHAGIEHAGIEVVSTPRLPGRLLGLVLVGHLGCGGSPLQSEPPPVTSNCRLGAMTVPAGTAGACTVAGPGCPSNRPESAPVLLMLSTCGFANETGTCEPLPIPLCPRGPLLLHLLLVNPRPPVSFCAGEITARMDPKANGGATLSWQAQEMAADANGVCRPAGEEFSGTVDSRWPLLRALSPMLSFPGGGFTFRMIGRTDWER